MAENLSQFLSILLLLIIVTLNFAANTKQDAGFPDQTLYASPPPPYDCPYPCDLPPPITTTSNCPPPPSPPLPMVSPPSPPGSDYYSPPFVYYSPPSGYLGYHSPPPWYLDNAPPPPDPILPYFPFYYKRLPPNFSSAARFVQSMVCILSLILLSVLVIH